MEQIRFKRLIKTLSTYHGTNTSMITLTIRPDYQISLVVSKLQEEIGKTDNIKDRTNADFVKTALVSTIGKLKSYPSNRTGKNGLCLFSGVCLTPDGKSKTVNLFVEPLKPVEQYYRCDKTFHTEALLDQLNDDKKYGFMIVTGEGTLYSMIQGNQKDTLAKFVVDLPKKHNKGGQSSVRFARLREEARHNYVRKVCENANRIFIKNNEVNCSGIIIAGMADFKRLVHESPILEPKVRDKVLKVVDISYGFELGLDTAIKETKEVLENSRLSDEIKELTDFFDRINKQDEKIVYGPQITLQTMSQGLLEKIIVNEENKMMVYKTSDKTYFDVKEIPSGNPVIEEKELIDWLIEDNTFGSEVVFVSDRTNEGSMFCNGFSGLGGILRFAISIESMDKQEEETFDDFI